MKIALLTLALLTSFSKSFASSYVESKNYLMSVPMNTYNTEGNIVKIEAQIGIDEQDLKKAELKQEILKEAIAKAVAQQGYSSMKTPEGKFLLKGRVLYFLSEAGITANEVHWNRFQF